MKKIKIGLVGFGTIGCGVIQALQSKRAFLREKSGIDVEVSKICDKDLKTKRPVSVAKKVLTQSVGKLLYDPGIDIIVELVGGIHPAKDIVMEALRQGKHVVTANKALLSEAGSEIFGLSSALKLLVGFEASVGGGIPIIKALKEGFIANKIDLIYGIINGTSNFILSKMSEEGYAFEEALKIAQERGYAEKNPALDINGSDSCHKLSILSMLAFGLHVKPGNIYTEGIDAIEPADIQYAKEIGYSIKLLAIAKRSGTCAGGAVGRAFQRNAQTAESVEMRVHPTLIPKEHLLANVGGVYNAVFVKGDLVGENLFYGRGAGALPTSSAVVSDVIDIARKMGEDGKASDKILFKSGVKHIKDMDDVRTRYYLRVSAIDRPGVLAKISGILGKHGISIATVAQKEKKASKVVPVVMMTHEAEERQMAAALKEIDALSVIKKKSVRVRIEG